MNFNPSAQRVFRPVATLVVAVFLVVASACSTDSSADTSGIASLEPTESLDFSQCMRDEGLDFPDIGLDINGNPDIRAEFQSAQGHDGFREALDSCRSHLDGAGFGGSRAASADNVEVQDAFIEFSACVRDAGYDVGDLQLGGPGQDGRPPRKRPTSQMQTVTAATLRPRPTPRVDGAREGLTDPPGSPRAWALIRKIQMFKPPSSVANPSSNKP